MVNVSEMIQLIKEIDSDNAFMATFEVKPDTKMVDDKFVNFDSMFEERYGFIPKCRKPTALLRYIRYKERLDLLETAIK